MQRLQQLTFASLECDRKKRRTRREIFPERMDGLIPWAQLEARIAPTHPKPHPLPVTLRVHCVQLFCNLSDPVMEDRLARRRASGALPGRCLRRFRTRRRSRLPPPAGEPRTGAPAVREIRDHLAERGGGVLKKGTIVDATIISAPSSTRNRSNARDPEMHRTRKGNRWHFGMKLHIGTDPWGLARHPEGTVANVHDLAPSGRLLHGEEEQVWADAGYRGIRKRAAACAAFGLLEPDDCPAAPVMTREKRVRNLPDRPRGG